MNRNLFNFVLIALFILAFALCFFRLGEIPSGLYQDETAIGYNAYSILLTGKDEQGASLPLYFKSFGDYKLPIYIYATAVSVQLFGLNEFAVRFPSALFGFLTVIVFYFLVKDLTKSKALALCSTLLLAINPWHLHYSRATFEVSISLFLYILGSWMLLLSLQRKKRAAFAIGTLCFLLSQYTYNLTRLLSPVLFALVVFLFPKDFKKISKQELGFSAMIAAVFLLPFVFTLFQSGGLSSASGTLLFSSKAVYAPLLEFRSYLIDLPNIIPKLLLNFWAVTLWKYLENIASYFSATFFFISGSTHGNHGIGTAGQFYLFELVFIMGGLIQAFKNKVSWRYFLLGWAVIVVLVASLTREVPHATRSFFLVVPLEILSGYGLLTIVNRYRDLNHGITQKIIFLGLFIFVFYNIFYYVASYYIRFPIAYAKAWRQQDKAVSLYVKENQNQYHKIIFDKDAGFIYSSLLFYLRYPPDVFQSAAIWEPDDSEGFSMPRSFGKFEFRKIDWKNDLVSPNSLIITSELNKPKNVLAAKVFYYPTRPVVISEKEKLIQYPYSEVAYVAIKTK